MLKQMAASIIHRFKKLFILLCIIPIVTAGIAYFMEMGKETTYTASTKIVLGNFENENLSGVSSVKDYFHSEKLKEIKSLEYPIEEVKKGFRVEEVGRNMVEFKYTSDNKKKAEDIVQTITGYFLEESDTLFEKKYENVKNSVDRVKDLLKVYEDEDKFSTEFVNGKEEAIEFYYEQKQTLVNLRKNKLAEPLSISTEYDNPLKKAIFGFLVGIMLSLFILLIPELFKEYRDDERI
ncbi:hypothetical protein FHE72_22020 [Rossellomorea vietnamensis]|uniref:Lipopolysaccharide biosynthesis protein n=1 Tax=Rossellomorea vietnamensis TaxID=218284 RepID=A0A6I6UK20_9BACI|nr:hypothetical protein [Rossellomorea vietnamensis]QHE63365.1 hypothetical protein FHE72_22020 [Rossellomorea vietnamensis]